MSDRLFFIVPGEPVPKGRARTRVVQTKSGKAFASHYTPKETAAYEKHVATLCQLAVNQKRWVFGPKDRFDLRVRICRTHEGAGGDIDNYVKAIQDGINGIAFPDDRYIRCGAQWLEQDSERPRVEVCVTRIRIGEGRAA